MYSSRPAAVLALLMIASGAWAVTIPLAARGGKVVSMQVPVGTLTITVSKRDLNIYEGPDALIATLFTADGEPAATLEIPDDGNGEKGGGMGDLQTGEITVEIESPGMHRLSITGSSDMVWGLETNAPLMTVRGDMFFSHGQVGGQVYFMPPAWPFKITASALHDPGRQKMSLLDERGEVIHVFDLAETGEEMILEVERGARGGLWHFEIEHLDVKISAVGVTEWTTEPDAYFVAGKMRQLLRPYRQTRYLQPGEEIVAQWRLTNTGDVATTFALNVTGDEGVTVEEVTTEPDAPLKPGERATVRARVRLADDVAVGDTLKVRLSAEAVEDQALATSRSLEVRVGDSPVGEPLELPITLRRYAHENVQFGYSPGYMTNEVYFDQDNRPWIRQRTESSYGSTSIFILEEQGWVERPFIDTIRAAYPEYKSSYGGGGFLGAKIAFDGDGGAYTLLRLSFEGGRQAVVVYTFDRGRSYGVAPILGGAFDIEQFTGHNALDRVPPILTYTYVESHPARFASYDDLNMYLPTREGDKLVLGEPIFIAHNCLGSCQHSGGPASTVTRDGKTYIVWGEISPDDAPGVPTYVATVDHATRTVGEKTLLGYGPPVNDVHNVPAITMDSAGYLHVLIGSHGQAFQYVRSLKPNDAYGGWTDPVPALTSGYISGDTDADGDGRQTYISLVCGPDDALHSAFRQWRQGPDEHIPDKNFAALSVQRREADSEWGPALPIVVPPVPGYSIYYHKLTIDRAGDLYLSYSYWTSDNTYQDDFPGRYEHMAVVTSKDGGRTWKLAETSDFEQAITR
jgi:hypothetical protein